MRRRIVLLCFLLVLLAALSVAGCGNVYLLGDAKTAVQTSAMDSYLSTQKAATDPTTPAWAKAYIEENFRQWRSFARSALKDANWGPKLPGEQASQAAPVAAGNP